MSVSLVISLNMIPVPAIASFPKASSLVTEFFQSSISCSISGGACGVVSVSTVTLTRLIADPEPVLSVVIRPTATISPSGFCGLIEYSSLPLKSYCVFAGSASFISPLL